MRLNQHTSCALRRTLVAIQDSQGTSMSSYCTPKPYCALVTHLRLSYGQFMSLFSKTVAERTKPGQRQDVEEKCTSPPSTLIVIFLQFRVSADIAFYPTHSTPTVAQKVSLESSSATPTILPLLRINYSQKLLTSSFLAILAPPSPTPTQAYPFHSSKNTLRNIRIRNRRTA